MLRLCAGSSTLTTLSANSFNFWAVILGDVIRVLSAHKDIKKLPKLHHAIIKGKYEKVEKIAGVLEDSTRIHYQ